MDKTVQWGYIKLPSRQRVYIKNFYSVNYWKIFNERWNLSDFLIGVCSWDTWSSIYVRIFAIRCTYICVIIVITEIEKD